MEWGERREGDKKNATIASAHVESSNRTADYLGFTRVTKYGKLFGLKICDLNKYLRIPTTTMFFVTGDTREDRAELKALQHRTAPRLGIL